jgi:hypothetical protein
VGVTVPGPEVGRKMDHELLSARIWVANQTGWGN